MDLKKHFGMERLCKSKRHYALLSLTFIFATLLFVSPLAFALADCTGTATSPCHYCDFSNMSVTVKSPGGSTTSVSMGSCTTSGTCGTTPEITTACSGSLGYTFCPEEGQYTAQVCGTAAGNPSATECSSWFNLYTVSFDSSSNWCACGGYDWFSSVSGGSNGNCCGDDGSNDDFYYHSADPTTAQTLQCTRCLNGTKYGPTTLHGNGYWSGSDPATDQTGTCYYGDIICTDSSAANGDNTTLYGNGYVSGSTCYYGDITCGNGTYANGASCTLNTGGTCIADIGCLNTPTNLQITDKTTSSITLSWTDNSTIEDGFKIERSPDGSSWSQIATVTANTTSYTDSGLACNTKYYYRLRAYYSTSNSGYSNTASAYTLTTVPTSLSLNADSDTQLTLTWSECANNSPENWINETTGNTGGSDSTGWQTANTYVDTGLSPNTQYCYRVKAKNGDGIETAYSAQQCKYTLPEDPAPSSTSHTVGEWSDDNTIGLICSGAAASYYYVWDQSATTTASASDTAWDGSLMTKTATSDGNWYLHVVAVNPEGATNPSGTIHLGPFKIDTNAPTTTASVPSGWQTADFNVTLSCYDNGSGCNAIRYRIDGGSWTDGNMVGNDVNILISSDGNHSIEYYGVDVAGNTENVNTIYAALDKTPPIITITSPSENETTSDPTIAFTISYNNGSAIVQSSIQVLINGVAASDFNVESDCTISGGDYSCSFYQSKMEDADYNLSIIAQDEVGNINQLDRNFHFTPVVYVDNILPSGTLESGLTTISFTVHNTMLNYLYASIYYSPINAGKLSFEDAIATDLNLDAYETIPNLSCDSNKWWPPVQCTYTWNASGVLDGNYYIDINVWNEDGVQNQGTSTKQFLLDNTPPEASITDVSSTITYSDTVYLNCSDSGSGCVATRWYYFSDTQNCSSNKSDYNYSTTSNSITITDDHNDYICLWVEDRVGLHSTAISDQLHVDTSSWSITKGASQTITQVSSDLNNTCNFTVTGEINLECEFQSFVKIRQSAADINSTYTGTPTLVESPEKPIKVVLEEAITNFYNKDYFIKFESSTRTITSQGNEQDYPVTIVRRRIVPLLTADGQLDVGTLIIKIRKK
ncbi:MAG: hypothetical protein DRO07_00115 [Candidatus Iainarchaeum archaeon]|uniref:Fibronectin type III domain-containing protein n=1 Tax=Candidatus Iainarchaeum sp. TaxID=3101447 RepID=A0A497JHZ1_9ARCH|nr:MAG: hypothetical protein DRO07_00115 [Candidatus Diapherotrites archaeon]